MGHFNFEKHHLYLPFTFLNTVDLFNWLFGGFQTLNTSTAFSFFIIIFTFFNANTYTVPSLFLDRLQKPNGYLSVTILTSKNIICILFVLFLSLNMWFPPLSDILTWKCVNNNYQSSCRWHSKYTKHTLFLCL